MAEVGLVRFAGLALQVSHAVLPAQRTKFRKRIFTSRRATGFREQMRKNFPRRRSLMETVFSTVKCKLPPRAPGRSLASQPPRLCCSVPRSTYTGSSPRPSSQDVN